MKLFEQHEVEEKQKSEKRKLARYERAQEKRRLADKEKLEGDRESTDEDEIEAKIVSLYEMLERGVQSDAKTPDKKRKILAKVVLLLT